MQNKSYHPSFLIFLFLLITTFWSVRVEALSVRQFSLDDLSVLSNQIVLVTLVEQPRPAFEESRVPASYYTFRVEDCIKGDCGDTLVIKQPVTRYFSGNYEVGKTYLLFLPAPSERTGMVTPLGLWQGSYAVEEENGKRVIPLIKREPQRLRPGTEAGSGTMRVNVKKTDDLSDYATFRRVIRNFLEK